MEETLNFAVANLARIWQILTDNALLDVPGERLVEVEEDKPIAAGTLAEHPRKFIHQHLYLGGSTSG